MLTPIRFLLAGVVVFAVGVVFGTLGIDPVSAWIGTAGMALAGAAVIWLVLDKLRARGDA
jgi:hypothetical protein